MKILLTGGSGFIGTNLRKALGAAHQIVAPTHRELDVTDTNAVDEAFRKERYDAVIHAAVAGGEMVTENIVRGFWNIARNADKVDRVLYFGSGAEYGKHRDLVKIREEEIGSEVPRDGYGLAKLLCNDFARRSRNITNLRLFGIYGPHEGYLFKFISNSVAKGLLGMDLTIRQDVVFDYLWIDDLSSIVERFLERQPTHREMNVTPSESVTLSRIAGAVRSLAASPIKITYEIPAHNYEYTGSNQRLSEALPDLQFATIEKGIRELWDYYLARIDELDSAALMRDDYRRRCRTRKEAAF
jgi:nucleoside-diphosphate-sugar epimerase